MKADRLISLLLLLQSRRQCSARILAERLEVSERTIYRDVEALGAAGVPVYAERGSAGGIVLADGYRRALTQFSEDEIRSLFVSGVSPLADLGLERGLDRALEKLHGGLADVQRRAAEKSRSRIHVDQRRWNQPEPPRAILTALRRAVWDDRRVRIRYQDRNRAISTRTVDPLGLVSKAGVWYLVARYGEELRSFRVDRMRSAEELALRFERPAAFDLERYWRESSARFNETSRSADCIVLLRARADAVERVSAYWPAELVSLDGASALLRVTFPGREVATFALVAWSDVATLVEPEELREALVARARRTLERYAQR
ncbi:MAG: YafY family transcriptional regulator [Candidatus Eremiobacteraeota bacterium]|nr:YafY family transcriptional regulator [Candidatus Eremiobacteraeota bacterium]